MPIPQWYYPELEAWLFGYEDEYGVWEAYVEAQEQLWRLAAVRLSHEKASEIATKYLDKLPLKTGKWIMGRRCQKCSESRRIRSCVQTI